MRTLLIAAVAMLMLTPAVSAAPGPEPISADVYIPNFEECLWKGSWKPVVSTPVVTVWKYSCDGPGN